MRCVDTDRLPPRRIRRKSLTFVCCLIVQIVFVVFVVFVGCSRDVSVQNRFCLSQLKTSSYCLLFVLARVVSLFGDVVSFFYFFCGQFQSKLFAFPRFSASKNTNCAFVVRHVKQNELDRSRAPKSSDIRLLSLKQLRQSSISEKCSLFWFIFRDFPRHDTIEYRATTKNFAHNDRFIRNEGTAK